MVINEVSLNELVDEKGCDFQDSSLEVVLKCNFCEKQSEELKLITIDNRDYITCERCNIKRR